MKTLKMTLQKQWFDQIASGEKVEEYRDCSDFWISRLLNEDGSYKEYDTVEFRNGYAKDCPKMLVEVKGIELEKYEDSDGDENNFDNFYFVIFLGKVLKKYR